MCFFLLWYNIVTVKIYFVTVKIYVKLHHNSPILICMDVNRANKEIVDPAYLWNGPNENTLQGKLF